MSSLTHGTPALREDGATWYLVPSASSTPSSAPSVRVFKEPTKETESEFLLKLRAASTHLMSRSRVSSVGKGGGKNPVIAIDLPISSTFATTAGADYAGVYNIQPSSSGEWASCAALYEQCIVDGGMIQFVQSITTNFTTVTGNVMAGVVMDPSNNGALASLNGTFQHSQKFNYQCANPNTPSLIAPGMGYGRGNIYAFKWKTPGRSARSVAAGTGLFGHEWSSTSDSSDVYGFLKHWIPLQGATGIITCAFTVTLHMRFRSRT